MAVGALCVVFCFLYTTSLASRGLGDALVLVFFGLVPVCMVYYLQAGTVTLEALLASLACGLVIDTLLLVNNYRDIDADTRAGKRTLVVRLGARRGRQAYLLAGVVAVALGLAFAIFDHAWSALLPVAYLVLHYGAYRRMVIINKGKALNMVLGLTSRNMLVYGLLVSIGFLVRT